MTHSPNSTLFRVIKNNIPTALIVMIISLATINPTVAMSEDIKINGYPSDVKTEDASDSEDCE
jgi:hypothetical protein